jgi:hypothetical protein
VIDGGMNFAVFRHDTSGVPTGHNEFFLHSVAYIFIGTEPS